MIFKISVRYWAWHIYGRLIETDTVVRLQRTYLCLFFPWFYWRQVHILLGVWCVVGIAMNWHTRHVRSLLHSIDSSIPLTPPFFHYFCQHQHSRPTHHRLWCHLSLRPQANTKECRAGLNRVQLHYPPSAIYSISWDVWDINQNKSLGRFSLNLIFCPNLWKEWFRGRNGIDIVFDSFHRSTWYLLMNIADTRIYIHILNGHHHPTWPQCHLPLYYIYVPILIPSISYHGLVYVFCNSTRYFPCDFYIICARNT